MCYLTSRNTLLIVQTTGMQLEIEIQDTIIVEVDREIETQDQTIIAVADQEIVSDQRR